MRVLALDSDLIVFVSAFWQTTCTALRADDEGFVIDSPVLPHELEALPQVLEQSGFPVSGLLVTHGDWDHLLGPHAFPDASLGCGEPTAALLAADPSGPARELAEFDDEHYIAGRPPLSVDGLQHLPVPGRLELGASGREIELHPAPGHTADGTAYVIPWLGALVPGDYLSPVEIPWISANGSVEAYLVTLEQLRPLVAQASHVIPGHGGPVTSEEALRVLEEDVAYLDALRAGVADVQLPSGRDTAAQRKIHAENLGRVSRPT
jgi:glyoxylase-like metal-dependent hydrolase (beta-lactamase superfamily II)